MTALMPEKPAANEDVDLSGLTGSLGFLTRMAQLQVFDFFYEELGEFGLRPGEFSAFWVIHRNPGIRQGLLAQRLRIKRAHMTKMVRSLEDRGLVERTVPDDDRRSVALRLTRKGETFLNRNADAFFANDALRPSPLSERENRQLIALLQKFTGIAPEAER